MANIPRHLYGTRANRKRMENWGEAQEAIKANINLIKEQMS